MKANKENSSPSVSSANLDHPSQGSKAAQSQQKDPQSFTQQQQQRQEQSEQRKKPPPQPSPPRQDKHTLVDYHEEENEATAPPPKIPRLETTPLPLLPDWKPPIASTSGEDASSPVAVSDLPKVQILLPANQAPVHQPPSLGPPPPLPYSYVTGMSSTSSFMSGEGYQDLQSMTMTNGSSYGAGHPAYGPPAHLPYKPHVYSPNPPPPPVFPPPVSFLLPNIPLHIPRYPPLLPHINPSFLPPPPCRPPIHVAPPQPLRGLGLPPVSYLPAAIPSEGQCAVTTLIPSPGMPPVRSLGWATWMRYMK